MFINSGTIGLIISTGLKIAWKGMIWRTENRDVLPYPVLNERFSRNDLVNRLFNWQRVANYVEP